MKNRIPNFFIALGLCALVALFVFFKYDGMNDEHFELEFKNNYSIFSLNLPDTATFAGEIIPIEDPEIYERFDRELLVNTYWQSSTLLYFKRSHRYFPIIEPILQKHGVPDDFKYLALVESGLTNVVSGAGAVGFWQILESTAKLYGLEVSKEVDERYHLEKSTEAACLYLKEAYRKFGSWTLAAASYNMGMGGINKQLERQQGSSYFDLKLNHETARYVFRMAAVKQILENPNKYGFNFREKDLYNTIPTRSVLIDSAITDLGLFAKSENINYRILKYHNPWLRYHYLPKKGDEVYEIKIPLKGHYHLSETAKVLAPADSSTKKPASVKAGE